MSKAKNTEETKPEDTKPDAMPQTGQELSVEQRLARLENVVQVNYDQFLNHQHTGNGTIHVPEQSPEATVAGSTAVVDQTSEAEERRRSAERRAKLEAEGHPKDAPLPADEDETDDNEVTDRPPMGPMPSQVAGPGNRA